MQTLKTTVLGSFACALLLLSSACGGGSSAPISDSDPNPPVVNPPAATGLSGQILQDGGAKVSSAADAGLQGAVVGALRSSDGKLQASQTVGADGRFNFKALPSGDFLVRVNFTGDVDLDGDGSVDDVEVIMPATVQGNSSSMVLVFASVDSDSDGKADSLEVRSDLRGSQGLRQKHLKRINCERRELVDDENGDDVIDDNDEADADADLDGIPDGGGHHNSLHGGVLHGEISAIDSEGLTVDGVTFSITDATRWRIRGNKHADPEDFNVGRNVIVRGLWNGEEWIALEVKSAGKGNGNGHHGGGGNGGGDESDDDSIARFGGAITGLDSSALSVGDNDFVVNEDTKWRIRKETTTDLSLFDVGDIVLVKASFDGDVWTALEVRLILNLVKDEGSGGGDGNITASFNGLIDAFGEDKISVDGHRIRINDGTLWEAAGAATTDLSLFDVGDEVQVDASYHRGVWTASKITLLVNNVSDEPGGPLTQTFSGDIAGFGEESFTVGEQLIVLNGDTSWLADGVLTDDLSLFDIGDGVEVDAESLDGTVWTAVQVRLITNNVSDESGPQTFTGHISAISETGLTLEEASFTLNGETQWILIGGLPGDPSLFGLGDEVEVLAQQDGEIWTALSVTLLTDLGLGGI